ncbi:MAG: D-alanyl-D-alanine carboxypeptidase [Desulfobacterales bacterium]|nr:D-alanyl-D-alanine carboxypeptidase [Desulfobacterales bacterium]MBF0397366.1 D-alanyl-D-alanine carboxypeptidase [Desulfobacterales bacterium]
MIRRSILFFIIFIFSLNISDVFGAKPKNEPKAVTKSEKEKTGGLPIISKSPYVGAITIDSVTGKVLFEDNPDTKGYPASVIKLMNLLIILEHIDSKALNLQDKVTISADAAKIGGSQVYLKVGEVFTIDELLYALMVQSANDAATALSMHLAGTKEAFVDLMNKKAKDLGMSNTIFHSVHGLPPSKDQEPDMSTPRDIAKLCMELLKHKDALRYTSTQEKPFRPNIETPFIMRNHNHLLGSLEGCDGFKTGYFRAGGFSIAATATKKGARAIAVVIGSFDRKVRDAKAKELLSKGLIELAKTTPAQTPVPAVATGTQKEGATSEKGKEGISVTKNKITIAAAIILPIVALFIVITFFKKSRVSKKRDMILTRYFNR